jgi:hypothetical protein
MRKLINLLLAGGILAIGVWLGGGPAQAQPDFAQKESKDCAFCHTNGDPSKLTDAGKYYKDNKHSLKGYRPKK